MEDTKFSTALVSGAVAGISVDMALFPVDTVKTRLQSPQGFAKAGGFRGIYSGVASTATGSMPTAALFFCTYEFVKDVIGDHPYAPAFAGAIGEIAACTIRVPVEVVKQRSQASRTTSATNFLRVLKTDGPTGFYRGYWSTICREMPFSFIQFPLWEGFKKFVSGPNGEVTPQQSAYCGAMSSCIAAGLTNPLDMAKTRIMLAESGTDLAKGGVIKTLTAVYEEKGVRGFAAGIGPRMLWMSIGGFIFLGSYDLVKGLLTKEATGM